MKIAGYSSKLFVIYYLTFFLRQNARTPFLFCFCVCWWKKIFVVISKNFGFQNLQLTAFFPSTVNNKKIFLGVLPTPIFPLSSRPNHLN